MLALRTMLQQFINANDGKKEKEEDEVEEGREGTEGTEKSETLLPKQVVLFGAGFDTTYFQKKVRMLILFCFTILPSIHVVIKVSFYSCCMLRT